MDVDKELKFGSFYISFLKEGFLEKRETIVGKWDSLSFLRRKLAATILI